MSDTTHTTDTVDQHIAGQLAQALSIRPAQVMATIDLLDEGATVPFIARYRKEHTGGLDDTTLRELAQRLAYLRELEERRQVVLASIAEQGKLTPKLKEQLVSADSKQRLEDLYAPYRPRRRTRAQIAREAGLERLVTEILADPTCTPLELARAHVQPDTSFNDARATLNGARDILAETWSEEADLLASLRNTLWNQGRLYSAAIEGKENEGANFKDWFDFSEPLQRVPSHRALAMLRGRQQGVLKLTIGLSPEQEAMQPHPCVQRIATQLDIPAGFDAQASARAVWLAEVCRWTWRVRLLPAFETELLTRVRETAEQEAIRVFADNLKDLLLAAPAGPRTVLGLDPGIRTGVKMAAIDTTGKVLETNTIYPFQPRNDGHGSLTTLTRLVREHRIELVAIGNGTASREIEKLIRELKAALPDHPFQHIVVSEAGASVYSASEAAAQELPDMDVSLRGAVSIARRLQDPLAELVKIEPKAIGVGQYQHDVSQRQLAQSLDHVIEDCVNAVGVNVNTASPALLSRVSGLSTTVASNIVQWRNQHGAFNTRKALLEVPRFGPKTFEQAAGFLRIPDGSNPLDRSAVHPEAYELAQRILDRIGASAAQVMGQTDALKALSPKEFIDDRFGLPTVKDILSELEKPGRDPRPAFSTVEFAEGIASMADLKPGMQVEGVVSNVANFGAFVDIGIGQDGLVHISALADRFVKDPRDVVRVGQRVTVRVMEVDTERKRVALSMRSDDEPGNRSRADTRKPRGQAQERGKDARGKDARSNTGGKHTSKSASARKPRGAAAGRKPAEPGDSAMAAAFARLRAGRD